MRFIPTTAHGLADYIVGLVVVGLPFYFGWIGTGRIAFVTLGLLVICYSLLTDYALGLVRVFEFAFTSFWTRCSAWRCWRPPRCSASRTVRVLRCM